MRRGSRGAASRSRPRRCDHCQQPEQTPQARPVRNEPAQRPALEPLRRPLLAGPPPRPGRGCPRASTRSARPNGHAVSQARHPRAQVRLLSHEVRQGDPPLGHAAHEIDAASRRRGLSPRLPVGGTGGKAEATVHAVERSGEDLLPRHPSPSNGRPRPFQRCARAERPGFRSPPGSKRCLRLRRIGSARGPPEDVAIPLGLGRGRLAHVAAAARFPGPARGRLEGRVEAGALGRKSHLGVGQAEARDTPPPHRSPG